MNTKMIKQLIAFNFILRASKKIARRFIIKKFKRNYLAVAKSTEETTGSLETSENNKKDFVELKTASSSLVNNSFIQALNSTVTPDISEVMKIVNEKPKVCSLYFA